MERVYVLALPDNLRTTSAYSTGLRPAPLSSHIVGATQHPCPLFNQGLWSQLPSEAKASGIVLHGASEHIILLPKALESQVLLPGNRWSGSFTMFCMWKGNINISKRCMHTHASCSTGHSSQKHGISQTAHKWMNEWVNTAYLHNEIGTKDRQKLDNRYQNTVK